MSSDKNILEIPKLYNENSDNLYDVFLNASLQRSTMLKLPIDLSGINLINDRWRHERTWLMFLYVLIEAWESKLNAEFRHFLYTTQECNEIKKLLKEVKRTKQIDLLRNIRDYMAHRDEKKFWDQGRKDVLNNFTKFNKIHQTFSNFFLIPKSFV